MKKGTDLFSTIPGVVRFRICTWIKSDLTVKQVPLTPLFQRGVRGELAVLIDSQFSYWTTQSFGEKIIFARDL
jgi:hypothetical protein